MAKQEINPQIPTLGQPVWIIVEAPLEERISISGERGYLNSLVYFTTDAIKAMKLGYADDTLRNVIINENMVHPDDPKKSLEIRYNIDKNFKGEPGSETVFIDEALADSVVVRLNKNQKTLCGKLVDLITKGYNEYDKIIAIHKGEKVS